MKSKIIKRPKRPSLPSLITKADTITSLYIRQKHADEEGNVKCVSCSTVLPWKESHCAHFIGRAKKATRWLEENMMPACQSCNVFRKEFHMREYTIYILEFYGREFLDELRELEKKVLSASQVRQLAEEAIERFKKS